ncbi:MAG: glycosyltransferase family 4 protein [Terriglobia bacterium]
MTGPRVGLIHPRFELGGSEAVALWSAEALKADHRVSLIAAGEVDLARLNLYYGTHLNTDEITIVPVPLPFGLARAAGFAALRGRLVQRFLQRIPEDYDVLIGCYGPMDVGSPAIQIIQDFSFSEEWRARLDPVLFERRGLASEGSMSRKFYLRLCDWVSPVNEEAWKRNLTLVNSKWTCDIMKESYGIESKVVYPPVACDFPAIPLRDRDNGFVCLGRVAPEKRVDVIIRILAQLRQRGHRVHLHILGGLDESPYATKVKTLAEQHKDWVFLEGWAMGQRKIDLLAGHRYGIHGRGNEPFGIAVAEMVLAGCIVFVPQGGGQMEIVNHPALVYENEADAVEKIDTVLTHEAKQENLHNHLCLGSDRFSVKTFVGTMQDVVARFLEEKAATKRSV